MEIGLDGLRTLTAVLREGTFDAAAASLHITPSAVSQRIKALELQVGRVLLRRTKPATATADGEVLIRLAEQWELLAAEARAELVGDPGPGGVDRLDRPRIHLPIASNADSLATWLLPVIAQLHRDHPVTVEVLRDDETRSATLLRSGDVLGAVTSEPAGIRGCELRPLGAMRYLPVATPEFIDTWLPDGPQTSSLARAPMVMFDRNDHLQHQVAATIAGAPLNPPTTYVPASAEYHRAIELGVGWGAVPESQIRDALAAGRVHRISDTHHDVPLYWQYWRLSSPLLQRLTELIVDAARGHLV
ncbi:LysR family transcriptional regulator ArgP [Gordonia sp. ABSL1-1]|uniref:LysR family transcriptional regulator ArgP n=1 Tax=Gordonia sp. ABSL1-1 TaxID=3053923 RepID=UPI00257324DF|nr:LysR family transcriptional regulator ArgP [Gordonia sp. ABSL1-1]MDL9935196.1 LysR family transcriptional regulator ArgP [Gordonia sp. ABSL1-1]